MKRSEALEEIRKILAMNGKDNSYGELEEAILHHLEVIGMLPPRTDSAECGHCLNDALNNCVWSKE